MLRTDDLFITALPIVRRVCSSLEGTPSFVLVLTVVNFRRSGGQDVVRCVVCRFGAGAEEPPVVTAGDSWFAVYRIGVGSDSARRAGSDSARRF